MIENRLTAARREGGLQGLGEKVKGLSKKTKQNKTKKPLIYTDNRMVITRRKRWVGKGRRGERGYKW